MINNLNHGINFKNEQNRVLCEINQNLSRIVSRQYPVKQVLTMVGNCIWIRLRI